MNSSELYEQARKAMDAGFLKEAVTLFQQSALARPHFKTYELLGECLAQLERYSEAVVYLAAATAINRGVRAPSLLAQTFLKLDLLSDAKSAAQTALSQDPTNRLAKEILAKVDAAAK